jgi:NAD+ kinase
LPATVRIDIQVGKKGRAILVADGQRSKLIKVGQVIKFEKADYYVKLIKPIHTTYFHTLREKMKWGGREDA